MPSGNESSINRLASMKSGYQKAVSSRTVFVCGCMVTCLVITIVAYLPMDFNYNILSFRSPETPQCQTVQLGLDSTLDRTSPTQTSSAVDRPSVTRLKLCKPSETNRQKSVLCADQPITREKALLIPACTNLKHPPDRNYSKLYRLSPEKTQLGSQIRVSVRLYNGYNTPVTTGGHALRVRIFNDDLKAAAPGRVQDHLDGTYTVTLDALWVGKAIVQVNIAYTREAIRALYYWRKEALSTHESYAVYKSGGTVEKTACHVIPAKLTQFPALCNFTYENSGSPWYCGKPRNQKLLCEDFVLTGSKHEMTRPISTIEETLLKRSGETINQNVSFDISEGSVRGQKVAESSATPCSQYNTTNLWTRTETTGVLYNGTWRLRHCKAPSPSKVQSCLTNRRLLIFGDSTARHWLVNARTRFNCQLVTEGWPITAGWHRRAECVVKSNKLAVSWIPHCQPFQVDEDKPLYTMRSFSHLTDLSDNDNAFIIVHVFVHVTGFDDDVFRVRIRHTRQVVETFLKRNKVAKVFIKGPHTYHEPMPGRQDFFGFPYREIIIEEFYGLYDRVIYLDNNDITVATNNYKCHPPVATVTAMVDQMFAYGC